jgi:hypothetical protein
MRFGVYKPQIWEKHRWFAWWPVRVNGAGASYVWLEFVMRVRMREKGWFYTLPKYDGESS